MRDLLDSQIARDLTNETGLSDADYTVLVVLSEAKGQRQRLVELADRLLWSQSRLSHQLSRMEDRGLVRREPGAAGTRAMDAVLTREGRRVITRAAPTHVESVRRHFVDLLTAEQLATLGDITEAVIDHLRAGEPR
jgi:DNA-binding MarR family transcriptional regulator